MSDMKQQITFSGLLDKCSRIVVPQIQRDYAQGRDSEKEVRESFLTALYSSLALPAGHEELPLNLDFIYGNVETGVHPCFLPLDGQQRLTTLFLLHWYLAWRDGKLGEFKQKLWSGKHSRFTYAVRPSSTEFFDELVKYAPVPTPNSVPSVKKLVEDQPWFFLYWRLDPTIQSALTMLDAIHERFMSTSGLYDRLVHSQQPVITFQLLQLEHFGLSDDLYIKMNARGKPLTQFETFKARFEERLEELFPTERRQLGEAHIPVPQFFAVRMDTQWTDFFWSHRTVGTAVFDDAVMNLLWALARISLDPDSPSFRDDTTLLRTKQLGGTYTLFHERGWLSRSFAENLICLLEAWTAGDGKLTPQLPNKRYFDEVAFFQRASKTPAGLEYTELVQFACLVFYLRKNEGKVDPAELQEWMRVVFNLSENSLVERPDEYERSLAGLKKLLPHSRGILQHLASMEIEPLGFSLQQVQEEIIKAKLILAHNGWRSRIEAAESHGYLRGQIDFLLDFSGVNPKAQESPISEWANELHIILQGRFDEYLKKAQITFDSDGLISVTLPGRPHLWQRALLAIGDYLPRQSQNYSFLSDPPTNWDSWKRFLRAGISSESPRRQFLQLLWDRLDPGTALAPQLDHVINSFSNLDPWRAAMVTYPEVISYCEQQEIRWNSDTQIYLLRKRQMNGSHAELFSYVLHQQLKVAYEKLAPLKIEEYVSVRMTEVDPHVLLTFDHPNGPVSFAVENFNAGFRIYVDRGQLDKLPQVAAMLKHIVGFTEGEQVLERSCSREEIHDILRQLAASLASLAAKTS